MRRHVAKAQVQGCQLEGIRCHEAQCNGIRWASDWWQIDGRAAGSGTQEYRLTSSYQLEVSVNAVLTCCTANRSSSQSTRPTGTTGGGGTQRCCAARRGRGSASVRGHLDILEAQGLLSLAPHTCRRRSYHRPARCSHWVAGPEGGTGMRGTSRPGSGCAASGRAVSGCAACGGAEKFVEPSCS